MEGEVSQDQLIAELQALSTGVVIDLSLPYTLGRWIAFMFAVLLAIGGLFIGLVDPTALEAWGIFFIGCILLAILGPTRIQRTTHKVRAMARPLEVKLAKDRGGVDLVNFWNSATVTIPRHDDRAWILPEPKKDTWHLADRYAADNSGVITEHPSKIGTPVPATISWFGLGMSIAAMGLTFAMMSIFSSPEIQKDGAGMVPWIILLVAIILFIGTWWGVKRVLLTMDTPTSLIRSMAVGPLELVGQARNWIEDPEPVIVDDDPSKQVDDLLSWHWTYEVLLEWTETVTDSQGNTTTKTRQEWRMIRQDSGGTSFVLHDGSGGVLMHPQSFSRRVLGDALVTWECRHDLRINKLFRNLYMSMGNKEIKKHRWRIYGLKTSDPVYVLGTAVNREDDSIANEKIDRTMQNALLEISGEEKHVGFTSRWERGTELSTMSRARSLIDAMTAPTIFLMGALLSVALTL